MAPEIFRSEKLFFALWAREFAILRWSSGPHDLELASSYTDLILILILLLLLILLLILVLTLILAVAMMSHGHLSLVIDD